VEWKPDHQLGIHRDLDSSVRFLPISGLYALSALWSEMLHARGRLRQTSVQGATARTTDAGRRDRWPVVGGCESLSDSITRVMAQLGVCGDLFRNHGGMAYLSPFRSVQEMQEQRLSTQP
jgi:hypothetical protein